MLFTVTTITTFDEVLELAWAEATGGIGQLEWPQEIASLLEVGTGREDFMDEIFDAHDPILAQRLFNDVVIRKSNARSVHLSVTSLVNQLADGFDIRISVGDIGINDFQHLRRGLGELDEHATVDLKETEKLQDLAWLRRNFVDTETMSAMRLFGTWKGPKAK